MTHRNVNSTEIATLLALILLSGCVQEPNYAPVYSHFPEHPQDQDQHSSADVKKQPAKTDAPKDKTKTPPKAVVNVPDKPQVLVNKSKNKPVTTAVSNGNSASANEKKLTISIDKEKVLKLNFQWPLKGKVVKKFSQSHDKGIEIAGKVGQPVAATEAGKVVYSGQGLLGYGNLLIIKHNDLYLSAYANNSRLLVAEGNLVAKGQVIAEVGQVGNKRPALHFEIRKNGKPIDPMTFLSSK